MRKESEYIYSIYTAFTALVAELPKEFHAATKKDRNTMGNIFRRISGIETSEHTQEFIDIPLNSADIKTEMLAVFDRVYNALENSGRATPAQLEKMAEIRENLVNSIEYSAAIPHPYQTKWRDLLEAAGNEKSDLKER